MGSRTEVEAKAAEERAEDDGHWAELISVHRICPDHEEQPKDACEECLTEYGADEDAEPEPIHMREGGGTLCGKPGPDTAGTGHVNCVDCRELLAEEADRHARGVYLCPVWEVPTDECECSDCEALHADDQADADRETTAEGRVIAHAGATLGTTPEHANNPTVRAAITALTNAGYTPAAVNGEFDPTPGDGTTGFYVEVRYAETADEIVYVHDVLDGSRTWKRDNDSKLSDYAKALYDAGWSIPTGHLRAVPALSPIEPAEALPGVFADSAVSEMYNHPIPGAAAPAVVGFATEVGTVDLSEDGNAIDGVRYPATSEGFTAFADELDRRTENADPSDLVRAFIANGRQNAAMYATAERMGKARAEVLMSASSTGRLDGHPASLRALVAKDLAVEVQEHGRPVFYRSPLGVGVSRARALLDAARATA
ncbi:hypothetical protein KGD82_16765 [Nocardiopsis eucommiae]|uniref:Uncharacterized protein n=1 Tax=Nocardiopsis eucommiae TaxID=2831970 RepID=A0A975QI15_9ACTN|nr:hypothetical protein KGD82_16765 [Nocardiopsis eucommiae]